MNQTRRNFWKFLVAAPASLVAPLVSARSDLVSGHTFNGGVEAKAENVTITNCVFNIPPKTPHAINVEKP